MHPSMSSLTRLKANKFRVGILSLGCPKTLVDSELILGKLDPSRYDIAPSVTDCDVALINTCAFIEDAQRESIDHILQLIGLKKEGIIKRLIVMGCLTQRFAPELQKELKEVDAFVGSGEYAKIPSIIERATQGQEVVEIGLPGYLYTSAEKRVSLTPTYSRYLKISEGCDHTCSFCVIPSFRGKHRSRGLDDVVEEAKRLQAEGARELILTGQDTTFFGHDTHGQYLLPQLLEKLNGLSGIQWIRILYAYPSLVSEEMIAKIASLDKVCHYLDMPLQHASDRILKSMKRGTTRDSTRRLIEKLRSRIPDLAIRTTFIVGYPGETPEEYQELIDFIWWARFERMGIFTFSAERGSFAAQLPGQVPEKTKKMRLQEAMLIQQTIAEENNKKLMGKELDILVEEWDPKLAQGRGRTYMDAPEVDGSVFFCAEADAPRILPHVGEFITVQIQDTKEYDLVGVITKPSLA